MMLVNILFAFNAVFSLHCLCVVLEGESVLRHAFQGVRIQMTLVQVHSYTTLCTSYPVTRCTQATVYRRSCLIWCVLFV